MLNWVQARLGSDASLKTLLILTPFGRGKITRLKHGRARRFKAFTDGYIPSVAMSSSQLVRTEGRGYDVYLAGSDRIWHYWPRNERGKSYLREALRRATAPRAGECAKGGL